MASVRLSSSRNWENSGANLIVSFCALRRLHAFCAMIVSDQIDMSARVMTMPQAKVPMSLARSSSDSSIVLTAPQRGVRNEREFGLSRQREVEGLLDQLLHLASTDLGGVEAHAAQGLPH